MKLQVNTSGSWKDVATFEPARLQEVKAAALVLGTALGRTAKWCVLLDDGKRLWIDQPLAQTMKAAR